MFARKKEKKPIGKKRKILLSFGVTVFLLIILFFVAVNTGSLSVGFGQLVRGLFMEYDPDVAAVYDLRFPRIFISLMAGAATAVSGVLFQAVLKNPLADPGLIGEIKGEAKPTKQQIKVFHDEIVQGYAEIFSGDKDVVGHMKELWFYLITLFPEKRDCLKKIQKCHDMVEYRLIVQQILS